MKICITCANELTGRQKSHCSKECASKAFNAQRVADGRLKEQRKKQSVKRKEWTENAKEERECDACGKTFKVYRYAVSAHCSASCGLLKSHKEIAALKILKSFKGSKGKRIFIMGRCDSCGKNSISCGGGPQPKAIYCSNKCAWRSNKTKRRALGANAKITKGKRYQVFERDNWICQICGDPVNRTPNSPIAPDAACVDHRLPLARGGSHGLENWQTAHQYCNGVKGARVDFSLVN